MKKNKIIIGIIGYGNMGKAIVERISPIFNVIIFDKDKVKSSNVSSIAIADSAVNLIAVTDVVIIAVKPQDFGDVLGEIKNSIDSKLIISIAAGITTKYIEKVLGKVRVIRVMPNLPAKIGKGMSCLCKGKFAITADLKFAKKILNLLGETLILDESMMDKATAVSGSGPGFLYSLISGKSLEEAKKCAKRDFLHSLVIVSSAIGFTPMQARVLAKTTTLGSIEFLEKSGLLADDLLKQVASKGGTTEAGLKELKGNIKFLPKAIKAAVKRAKELSRK